MTSRTTDDYAAMAGAGVRAVLEPAFWLGQPRTGISSFVDYFDALLGWEPYRAAQFGIAHRCAIALNPKEANDARLVDVLDLLPRYLAKDHVVAVGEVGYDGMTRAEDEAFAAQLRLAGEFELPVLVHTPHRDKAVGTRRSLERIAASGTDAGMVLLDHLNELTVEMVLRSGHWAGFSIYPDTKMSAARMVRILDRYGLDRILVNSAADWGRSDPLATRRTAEAMLAAGFGPADVDRVFWRNPVEFYGRSGRLDLSQEAGPDGAAEDRAGEPADYEGNTLQRGEAACVCDTPTVPASTSPTAPTSILPRTSTVSSIS
jgi:predicted metal-dependent TIM-barrel fold hydrolase